MFQHPALVQTHQHIEPNKKIEIYYPMISGLTNHSVQQHINRSVMDAYHQLLKERSYYEPSLLELNGWFEVKTNQRGIFSVALYVYSYTGGAHGMTTIRTLTFDMTTGKQYTLTDLFKAGSNYQTKLLDIIKFQIKQREIPVISEPINFPGNNNFYIADKSLILFYQLYDLAPYYYGITYFPISIYDLQNIIDENGPLGKMMGSF
ncbi:DUF3298 and DUF4163 domain-containing protein [Bacillus sp. DNRA2]|uniref:DUF3298 and DUF4163 domain-containing protein n=1 Tax=Bacillus sp. DNRA2 TaxID=2723053 RepID=UPI00145EAC57|nr:DUF3298 and DUF4163 domain-containing protein [Bacillus sp. DNRA2]NMD69883.1 DUF3298 and DUF4163 domain-containing protein [Bacillus sp. DNRA2]